MLSVGASSTRLNEKEGLRVFIHLFGSLLDYGTTDDLSTSFKGTPL